MRNRQEIDRKKENAKDCDKKKLERERKSRSRVRERGKEEVGKKKGEVR